MRAGSIVAVTCGVEVATIRGVAVAIGVAVAGTIVDVGYGVGVGDASVICIIISTERRPRMLSVVIIQVPCCSSGGKVMARTVRPSESVFVMRSMLCVLLYRVSIDTGTPPTGRPRSNT